MADFSDGTHYRVGTKLLHINNITTKAYGKFTCKVKMNTGRENSVEYTLSNIICKRQK